MASILKRRVGAGTARVLVAFALALAMLAISVPSALACDITIQPAATTLKAGEPQKVTVKVHLTHKNCETPIDETVISAQGLEILSQTPWQGGGLDYQKQLMVVALQPGQASLSVVRHCSKGGDSAQISFRVVAGTTVAAPSASAPEAAPQPSAPATPQARTEPTPTPVPDPGVAAAANSAVPPASSSSGGGSGSVQKPPTKPADLGTLLAKTLQEPKAVGVALLLAMAAVGFLRRWQWLRRPLLLVSLGYLGFYLGGCLCPLGAIQNLALPETTLNQKVVFFVTLGIPLVATLFFGRLYCGWICPAGALQELVHFRKVARAVPPTWDRWPKLLKYPLFVALMAAVRVTGEPIFEGVDPFKAAFERGGEVPLMVALAAILGLSVFLYRPWCRYLCPMAVVFGVVSRLSLLRLVPSASCAACKLCSKACGSQSLTVDRERRTLKVDRGECLSCGSCLNACRKSALRVAGRALPAPVHNWVMSLF